jgi:hypothetical protein
LAGDRIAGWRAREGVNEVEDGDAKTLGADLQVFGCSIHAAGEAHISRPRLLLGFAPLAPFSLPFLQSSNPAILQFPRSP